VERLRLALALGEILGARKLRGELALRLLHFLDNLLAAPLAVLELLCQRADGALGKL
jgi:hypothetical protein